MKKRSDSRGPRAHPLAMELCDEAEGLLNFTHGEHVPMYSGILRCLGRQVQTATRQDMPLEAVAVACRIAFECCVHLQLLVRYPRRLQEWQSDRWFDEQAILKAFRRLHLPKEKPLLELQLLAVKAHIKLNRVPPP